MVEYRIQNKVRTSYAALSGFAGELYQKMIEQRMTSDFAVEEILAEAEAPFFTKNDDEKAPVGFWRGEFWGKWIISAVRACKYEHNEKLWQIIRASVDKIMSTADGNGYIGTYKDPTLVLPASKELAQQLIGIRCDFCWNVWCQKYTLWGLIEAYELFGDEGILTAAKRLADQLIDVVAAHGVNPCETGTFFGVASGSIMKPILLLYRHTGDEKLLDFALQIANGFENDEAKCIKIIKKSLLGIPVHLWNHDNPVATGRTRYASQKAYEMMSCFEGICELYRITGIEKYLTATKKFYDLILEYEYNRLMCVGFNDRFLYASSIEDAVSEPCDIIHFLRLTADLYAITGECRYADLYEAAFLNPFLASITRDGSWGARAIRSMSHHVSERNIVDMKYNHCCVNNMPRAFENAAQSVVALGSDQIFVNLYLPSRIALDGKAIHISDGYVRDCRVTVCVHSARRQTLCLRIPSWSKQTQILQGGVLHTPACGNYFALPLDVGDTELTICFDRTPRLSNADYFRDVFPLTPFLKKRYDLDLPAQNISEDRATLCIGPTLLSMSTQLGTTWEEMLQKETVNNRTTSVTAEPISCDGTLACYRVTLQTEKETQIIPMCDYASASNRFQPNDFSIFI